MIDPRNGEVLALASTPVYDASLITNPATADASFEALRKDKDQPLLPRATLGRYVPGSVFKIVTAIAGLGSNAISPATTYKEQPAAEQDGLRVQGSGSATGTTRRPVTRRSTSSRRPRCRATSGSP